MILWYALRFKITSALKGLIPGAKAGTAEAGAKRSAQPAIVLVGVAVLLAGIVGAVWWSAAPGLIRYSITRPSPLAEDGEVVARGSFSGQGGRTSSGQAIVGRTADGTAVLRLEDLDVTNGPDLQVWLSRHAAPSDEGQVRDGHAVGPLRAPAGSFHYSLPDEIDLAAMRSVVIASGPGRSVYGVAPLEPE